MAGERTINMLIVDYEKDNVDLIRKNLKRLIADLGYNLFISECFDGKDALETYKKHVDSGGKYDLILMDYNMPTNGVNAMNSMDTTLAMRKYQRENNFDKTKVIMQTASDYDDAQKFREKKYDDGTPNGTPLFDAVIRKPITKEKLKVVLDTYLN